MEGVTIALMPFNSLRCELSKALSRILFVGGSGRGRLGVGMLRDDISLFLKLLFSGGS